MFTNMLSIALNHISFFTDQVSSENLGYCPFLLNKPNNLPLTLD